MLGSRDAVERCQEYRTSGGTGLSRCSVYNPASNLAVGGSMLVKHGDSATETAVAQGCYLVERRAEETVQSGVLSSHSGD